MPHGFCQLCGIAFERQNSPASSPVYGHQGRSCVFARIAFGKDRAATCVECRLPPSNAT
jgi:hypothetical protein